MSNIKTREINCRTQYSRDGENWFDSIEKYDEYYTSKIIEYGVKAMNECYNEGVNLESKVIPLVNPSKQFLEHRLEWQKKQLETLGGVTPFSQAVYDSLEQLKVKVVEDNDKVLKDESKEKFYNNTDPDEINWLVSKGYIKGEDGSLLPNLLEKTLREDLGLEVVEVDGKTMFNEITPEVVVNTNPEVIWFNPQKSATSHSYKIGDKTVNEPYIGVDMAQGKDSTGKIVINKNDETHEEKKIRKNKQYEAYYGGKVKLPQSGDNMNTVNTGVGFGSDDKEPTNEVFSNYMKNTFNEKMCNPMMESSKGFTRRDSYHLTAEQQVRLEVFKLLMTKVSTGELEHSPRLLGMQNKINAIANTIINGEVKKEDK